MEFNVQRITTSSFIVVCLLLKHAVIGVNVDCMRNEEPHCCQTKCILNETLSDTLKGAACIVKEINMECNINTNKKENVSIPSIPDGKIPNGTRCKIHDTERNEVSCHRYNSHPICCKTPCDCSVKFDTLVYEIGKKTDCSENSGGNSDNQLCFQNVLWLHKDDDKACNLLEGDRCFIYTDGKLRLWNATAKEASCQDRTSNQTNWTSSCIIAISCSIVIPILLTICILCCLTKKGIIRWYVCGNHDNGRNGDNVINGDNGRNGNNQEDIALNNEGRNN